MKQRPQSSRDGDWPKGTRVTTDTDKAVYDLTSFGRFVVLISVILASTCYTATILVATTLLPQMQGGLSATQDEISWVMT